MKVLVAWNVWNNYDDVTLASEILKTQNDEQKVFEKLYLQSQGGFPEPPNAQQSQYLNRHLGIQISEDLPRVKEHVRFAAACRVLSGYRAAFQEALQHGCDYAVITNADAWLLDAKKLHQLLSKKEMTECAVAVRIGRTVGYDVNYGSYAPVFDDHFFIINVKNAQKHGVFEYDEQKVYNANLNVYGSIHYTIGVVLDKIVPQGMLYEYTHHEDAVNHFGECCGYSLLPWHFQPKFGFLHANCVQDTFLHELRAEMLKRLGLDRTPRVHEYCLKHRPDSSKFKEREGAVFFRERLPKRLKIWAFVAMRGLFSRLQWTFYGKKLARAKKEMFGYEAPAYRKAYAHILPDNITFRKI